jgi:DNA-binding beta-propeller fold protein YncE
MRSSVIILISLLAALSAHAQSVTLLKTVALPGVKGRFDHFAMDVKGRRVFMAALGNDSLEIVDVGSGQRLESIKGLRKPTGVLYLPEGNLIGAANGGDGTFRVYGAPDYKPVATIKSLNDADNVRFDPKANRVYVGYVDGGLAVIDPSNWKTLASIKLPAHPESFQLEREGERVFVNLPEAKQIAIVDRNKQTLVAHWPMEKFQANFPMALDEPNHRLFVGCRRPARLVVFDTAAGKPISDIEISGDTDDLFYDPKSNCAYVSCGEGFIDVVAGDKYKQVQRIPTRPGARTSFLSVDRRELYLAVPARGSDLAELRIYSIAD